MGYIDVIKIVDSCILRSVWYNIQKWNIYIEKERNVIRHILYVLNYRYIYDKNMSSKLKWWENYMWYIL